MRLNSRKKRLPGGLGLGILCSVLGASPQLAEAGKVGIAAAVNVQAYGTVPGAAKHTKRLGDNVFYNERIQTNRNGLVQVLLADGSTFTVGPNSNLVIDEFVYDPQAGTGKLIATFSKGVARYVGGKVSKKRGGVTVKIPNGTIGIRGGIANLDLTGGKARFSLLFGEELLFNGTGGFRKRIYQAGYTLQLNGQGAPRIRRTLQSDLGGFQSAVSRRNRQNGGIGRPPTDKQIAGSGLPDRNSRLGAGRTQPPDTPVAVRSTNLLEAPQVLDKNGEVLGLEHLPYNVTGGTLPTRK